MRILYVCMYVLGREFGHFVVLLEAFLQPCACIDQCIEVVCR
jgi:hypothetical protein